MDPSTTPPTGAPEASGPAPGTRLDVTIERPAALGRGVARVDGLTLLVSRGVPGEAVTVEVERRFPRYALARVTAVAHPALARVAPVCPHFEACGGCDWQHVDYPAQLAIKRAVLSEQLERIGGLVPPPDWPLVAAAAPLGYRDKLEFTPLARDGAYVPAFHGLDGQSLVPIETCHLAADAYTHTARSVLDGLLRAGLLPPPGSGGAQPLQRLTVQGTEGRDGAPGLAVLLHLRGGAGQSEGRLRRSWQQGLRAVLPGLQAACPGLLACAVQFPARMGHGGPRRSGPTVEVPLGSPRLLKRVQGRAYRVPHTAFFQVNLDMAGSLAAHVVEQVQASLADVPAVVGQPVFDLFGGVGLFALPLAERGLPVLGVDSDREGLRAAEESARTLGLASCRFQRADLDRAGSLQRLVAEHGAPGVAICDPPRRGLSAALCAALREAAPAAIVYVSCDGGTFARDAARLADDYTLTGLRGFDLFPQTHHLELVGTFRRRAAP